MRERIDLPFLAAKLFNTPHMLAHAKLDVILSSVAPRILEGGKLPAGAFVDDDETASLPAEAYSIYRNVAIIPVHGTLVRRGSWLTSYSGLSSYEGLRESFTEAITSPDISAILLDIDSPGGEAGGVFDLADELRALSHRYAKPIWAHANEMACSAAYAIACAAEQIWIARTGDIGSIGVVCAHLDQSKADAKAGYKWTYIYEGDHKIHGNPHEPLGDEAAAKLQQDCAALYEMFVEAVMNSRAMTAAQIRATKADTYLGQNAVNAGLADRVGTFDQALQALSSMTEKMPENTAATTMKGIAKCPQKTIKQAHISAGRKMTKKITPKTKKSAAKRKMTRKT